MGEGILELFISDLDGTLLDSDQKISDESVSIINSLIDRGLNFTIATARSIDSAGSIIAPLKLKLPVIVHNGVFIYDPVKRENMHSCFLNTDDAVSIIETYLKKGISPFVFTVDENAERKIYYRGAFNRGEEHYVRSRLSNGDKRFMLVSEFPDLSKQSIIDLLVIGGREGLEPFHACYSQGERFTCHFAEDIYSKAYWLEITHKSANKKAAVTFLKNQLKAKRLVCFGDHLNDCCMFEAADEGLAVSNAHKDLIRLATKVIGSNNEHAVARYLESVFGSAL
jgi:hypothetical protein